MTCNMRVTFSSPPPSDFNCCWFAYQVWQRGNRSPPVKRTSDVSQQSGQSKSAAKCFHPPDMNTSGVAGFPSLLKHVDQTGGKFVE